MGVKDIAEKHLEDWPNVFADIVNVLLFKGQNIVEYQNLRDVTARSQFKCADEIHEQERDVAKVWVKHNVRIAFIGLENQTLVDDDMALRIISYDGATYKSELLNIEQIKRKLKRARKAKRPDKKRIAELERELKEMRICPCLTVVLYFGLTPWTGPKSLFECFGDDIPEMLRPYINDYKINVIEVAFLEQEIIDKFQSDFRVVANKLRHMRLNEPDTPLNVIPQHPDELMKLMTVLNGDNSFERVLAELTPEERMVTPMTKYYEKVAEGFRAEGMSEGVTKGTIITLSGLVQDGLLTIKEAASRAKMTEPEFVENMRKYSGQTDATNNKANG